MPISIRWENEDKKIVRWTLEGAWTWDEFREAQQELHLMTRDLDYKVDVVADMRSAPALPSETFHNFKSAELKAVPNRDRVILVGASLLVKGMATTFNQVFRNRPTHFLLAETVEEALALATQPREPSKR